MFFCYSCSSNEKTRQDCFWGQVGKYRFDFYKTKAESGKLNLQKIDSIAMKELIIEFRSDSTFFMNRKVSLFYDTVGKWDAGSCGFEDPGILEYYASSIKQQFGACRLTDSFFTILSRESNQQNSKTFWFKKMR